MTHKDFDIIVSGHLCIDIFPGMEEVSAELFNAPGRLFEVGPIGLALGGAVANTGQALHQLGVRVGLMATVGGDLLSTLIVELLRQRDPALTEMISRQPEQPSSYSIILAPGRADRTFLHCTGTNSVFGVENVDFATVARARLFHLGYPQLLPRLTRDNGAELSELYRTARAVGVTTSLDSALPDPNGPSGRLDWRSILRNTLPYVDMCLPSLTEIVFMLRRGDFDKWRGQVFTHIDRAYLTDLADEVISMGPKIVGFKLGEYGMYLRTASADLPPGWANTECYHPAFQVEVVGTTGAGDSSYAGFLVAWLRDLPPADCLRWACAVGACNVEAADAISGVRTWAQTEARMAAGWPYRPERIRGF